MSTTQYWKDTHDIPRPICWIRGKGDCREHLIIGFAHPVAFITASCGCAPVVMSEHLIDWNMENMEHSTDGKTWKTCTIEPTSPPLSEH